jgi:hypothetical protein
MARLKLAAAGYESAKSLFSTRSIRSLCSTGSIQSVFSVGSIMSLGSAGCMLSVGSTGCILSIASAGSILSFGSARSILSVRSHGKILHVDDIPLRDWRRDRGKSPAPADKIDDPHAPTPPETPAKVEHRCRSHTGTRVPGLDIHRAVVGETHHSGSRRVVWFH